MKTDYWESSSQNNPQRIWAKIYHWKDRWQQSCGHAVIHISYLPTFGGWQIEPETEVINIFTAWYKSSSLLDSQSCLWRFMKLQSANKGCVRSYRRAKALTSVIMDERPSGIFGNVPVCTYLQIFIFLPGVIFRKIAQEIFTYLTKFSGLLGFNFFLTLIVQSLIFVCLYVYY